VACNYGDGAVVRADNRTARQLVAHLQFVVEEQQAEIDELKPAARRTSTGWCRRTPRGGAAHLLTPGAHSFRAFDQGAEAV